MWRWHVRNGPIVTAPDGKLFHLYDPIYRVGSLGGPTAIKHGTADAVTGPYNWHHLPDMPAGGENPAFVVFKNESTGRRVYSLWMGGTIRVAEDPAGPFSIVKGWSCKPLQMQMSPSAASMPVLFVRLLAWSRLALSQTLEAIRRHCITRGHSISRTRGLILYGLHKISVVNGRNIPPFPMLRCTTRR
jgi:hypothetical protein